MTRKLLSESQYDETGNRQRIATLRQRGVETWGPERVYVAPDVRLDQIEPSAVLKFAVLSGNKTFISRNTIIGTSGLAVLHDTQTGEGVQVGAGHYDRATLLAGVKVRGFAEFRQGTLLEEEAEVAHNVGLKHTILTAAVVAGSSINFCDVLMTGGTRRSDHSEVGSGTVHFNFDPRGDKFGSLVGDVRGVLLRSRRIFIGGNAGLIAPLYIDFGAVIAAGSTIRKDVESDELCNGDQRHSSSKPFNAIYGDLKRKVINTAKLVGNLHALAAWYMGIRLPFASEVQTLLYSAALKQIQLHVAHRISELDKVIEKVDKQLSRGDDHNPFHEQHLRIVGAQLQISQWLSATEGERRVPTAVLREYERLRLSHDHCEAVRRLSNPACQEAEKWLMKIPETILGHISGLFE